MNDENKKLLEDAIEYHTKDGVFGKMSTLITKPCKTQKDLSLAYTPGVGMVCLEIAKNKKDVWKYTNRGNSVAVLSDGSAVLGLGDIGPEAGYPVMEGKSVLFKNFANIDAMGICIDCRDENGKTDPKQIIKFAKQIAPTFGGINLEDIKAPECFEVEEFLIENLDIPVFHDDQHGTAIITLAGLKNALKIVGKKIDEIRCVFLGAGAAGIATANLYLEAGVRRENIIMCDSRGVINKKREGINKYKKKFMTDENLSTLEDAMKGADVFVGVSAKDLLTEDMIKSMAKDSIIFAMANPWPEIMPDLAKKAGARIVGTGRSDFTNQINNVLGFPGIFRGVLDTNSKKINVEMKIAAANALAKIANEKIDKETMKALKIGYVKDFENGIFDGDNPLKEDFIIPKPLDIRVVPRVARFVAEAAMKTGVAEKEINDLDKYENDLKNFF